jgi:hypothetical protein
MVGEYSALHGSPAIRTFRAVSEVSALRIPNRLSEEFLRRTGLAEDRNIGTWSVFWAKDALLPRRSLFQTRARGKALVMNIPAEAIRNMPVVQRQLLETLEKRLMGAAKKGPR